MMLKFSQAERRPRRLRPRTRGSSPEAVSVLYAPRFRPGTTGTIGLTTDHQSGPTRFGPNLKDTGASSEPYEESPIVKMTCTPT